MTGGDAVRPASSGMRMAPPVMMPRGDRHVQRVDEDSAGLRWDVDRAAADGSGSAAKFPVQITVLGGEAVP